MSRRTRTKKVSQLNSSSPRCAKECVDDIHLMFKNCYRYNKPEEDVCLMASSLEKFFLSKLKAMPPVEVELTAEVMRRGGLGGTPKSAPRPKKPSGPDLADSDSMQSATSDPLEIKPIGVVNQSGWFRRTARTPMLNFVTLPSGINAVVSLTVF